MWKGISHTNIKTRSIPTGNMKHRPNTFLWVSLDSAVNVSTKLLVLTHVCLQDCILCIPQRKLYKIDFRNILLFFALFPTFLLSSSSFLRTRKNKTSTTPNAEKWRKIPKNRILRITVPQLPRTFVIWHFNKTPSTSLRVNELSGDLLHPIIIHCAFLNNANSRVEFPYMKYRQGSLL